MTVYLGPPLATDTVPAYTDLADHTQKISIKQSGVRSGVSSPYRKSIVVMICTGYLATKYSPFRPQQLPLPTLFPDISHPGYFQDDVPE
jgi:hypothetical protein